MILGDMWAYMLEHCFWKLPVHFFSISGNRYYETLLDIVPWKKFRVNSVRLASLTKLSDLSFFSEF